MGQDVLSELASGLARLDKGAYARGYSYRGGLKDTSLHALLARLLDGLGMSYLEDVAVKGADGVKADFQVDGVLVFVDREVPRSVVRSAKAAGMDCLVVQRDGTRSDSLDHGIRVVGMGEEKGQQTIFLDDPSFNFDYAHILPKTKKCSVMHGHTSSVLVEIVGSPVEGMVVDFGDAKEVVREAVRTLDHKLFIDKKYVTSVDTKSIALRFMTVHGEFAIKAPKATTVLLDGEATVENLAKEVLSKIARGMPENVTAVGVFVYEGMNKGSHLIAKIHQNEVNKRRRRR